MRALQPQQERPACLERAEEKEQESGSDGRPVPRQAVASDRMLKVTMETGFDKLAEEHDDAGWLVTEALIDVDGLWAMP